MKDIIGKAEYLCESIDRFINQFTSDLNIFTMQLSDRQYLEILSNYLVNLKNENIADVATLTLDVNKINDHKFSKRVQELNHDLKDILNNTGILTLFKESIEGSPAFALYVNSIREIYEAALELQSACMKRNYDQGATPNKTFFQLALSSALNMDELFFKLNKVKAAEDKKTQKSNSNNFSDSSSNYSTPESCSSTTAKMGSP